MKLMNNEERIRISFLIGSLLVAFLLMPIIGGSDEFLSYAIWPLISLAFYLVMRRENVDVTEEMGVVRSNWKSGLAVSTVVGIVSGIIRYLMSYWSESDLGGIESYKQYVEYLPDGTFLILLCIVAAFPAMIAFILIEQLFYNSVLQSQMERYSNSRIAIAVVGLSFGVLHTFTPDTLDYYYGCFTIILGVVCALLFRNYKNVLAPTHFLSIHVCLVMLLIAL